MRLLLSASALFVLTFCALTGFAQEEAGDDEVIKLEVIASAMQFNHAAADEHFVGKKLQVQGRAVRIVRYDSEKDASPQYVLTLGAGGVAPGPGVSADISFIFPSKERPGLADIQPGAQVVVSGTCRGQHEAGQLRVTFEDCRLIRILKVQEENTPRTGEPTRPSTFPSTPPSAFPPGIPMRVVPRPG